MRFLILTQKVDAQDPNLGFFHRWIEEFARQCESVIVVCLFEGGYTLPANVRILSLGKEEGASRVKYIKRFYAYLWRERKNYDAVYVHMNQIYVILGGLLWRMLGKKVSWWYAHGAVSLSMRMAEKIAQIIFTSTPQGFRLKSKKVHIVGQGIDTDLLKPTGEKKRGSSCRLISVGRIGPVKHLEILIQALAIILETEPRAELFLYGLPQTEIEREYQSRMEELVRAQGLQGKVHFSGAVVFTDLPQVLSQADVFVQASQTGSLDKAVLDALAMDIPAVSTNEAFRGVPQVFWVEQNAEAIARAVLSARGKTGGRSFIVEQHSLKPFIARQIALLEKNKIHTLK